MLEKFWKKIIRRPAFSLWAIPAFLLFLISFVYRLLFKIKKVTTTGGKKLPVPVISVGNITVGGTGKTTLVSCLTESFHTAGIKVGVVSSGYGRVSTEAVVEEGYRIQSRNTADVGDEVMYLAHLHPEALFSIHERKALAAENLVANCDVDVVIVDDGFQHFALSRDIDIVAYDAGIPQKLLKRFPYGVLREALSALNRAEIVIITRSNFARDIGLLKKRISRFTREGSIYHAQFVASELIGYDRRLPVKYLEDKSVFLFAGIGNFEALRRQVSALAADVDYAWELSDHQIYDIALLESIKQQAQKHDSDLILTTGKDWVKLEGFDFGREVYYLAQTIDLDPGEERLVKELQTRLKLPGQVD